MRNAAIAEVPRDALRQLKPYKLLHSCTNSRMCMTHEVTQVIGNGAIRCHVSLRILCSKNVSVLYNLRDITTCTLHETVCGLEIKSFIFDSKVEKLQAMCAFRFACNISLLTLSIFLEVWELERF